MLKRFIILPDIPLKSMFFNVLLGLTFLLFNLLTVVRIVFIVQQERV